MTHITLRRIVLALSAAILGACGSGTLAILGGSGGGGGSGNAPTVVSDVVVGSSSTDAKASPVAFSFRLTDAESNRADVDVFYVPPGGGTPVPVALAGGGSLDGLAASPSGVVHGFSWDFAAQVPTGNAYAEDYRLTVRTRNLASSADSAPFAIGNDAPVISNVVSPTDEVSGIVAIPFTVADSSSDLVDIHVEYRDDNHGSSFKPATAAGTPLVNVATTPGGVQLYFLWDTTVDEPTLDSIVTLQITAFDGFSASLFGSGVASFHLDNNAAPSAIVNGSAFYATPDKRRGIPLPIQIADAEGDAVRVVVQYRSTFGTFPDLPADRNSIEVILANADLRRQYQIASEAPISFGGRVVPAGASTVRLPELSSSQSCVVSEGLTGRDLQILRPSPIAASLTSAWSQNSLSAPVAILPYRDGHWAFVLHSVGGSWQTFLTDLATGAGLGGGQGTGSGAPDTMVYEPSELTAIVASDAAGVWTIWQTHFNGASLALKTTDGSTALGPVRGLACPGPKRALLTVGNSLISVDASGPGAATETALIGDIAGACGIALDPKDKNRLYVAERDWVNPATSAVEGRVVVVDLLTLERKTLAATGAPFLRPDSIAIDERENRLLVLTDANTGDGTRELRAVDLNGGSGGAAFQVQSGIPDGCRGLSTGPEGLRTFVYPSTNDVWAGGGVEQTRTITAYEPATATATIGNAFAPALDAKRRWKIVDALDPRPTSARGITHDFVWDSSDLVAGGDVVLRAVPYDTEQGLATDTGVPRPVRPGLDVLPYAIGSAASTDAPASVAIGDFNGDGRLDLATANVGTDNVTLFFQGANGLFPAAPSATLAGVAVLAPLTDPFAVRAIDVDGDGDLDIVSANHGSNNLILWTQGAGGAFSTVVPSINGLNAPSDVAGAELNGDGRMDLVVANTGANRVAIYFRNALGLYPGSPSVSLGNASTGGPVAVAVGDLDRDGDLDIVSANQATNNVTIWYQTAPGTFAVAPSIVLGGAGLTMGPSSVAVGDVDGDGKLDIVCADRTGNNLTVFLQQPAGGFVGTPSFTLATSGAPIQPSHVEMTDVNGDGWLDLVASDGGNDLSIWPWQPSSSTFAPQPIVLGSDGSLASPSCVAAADFDGDGNVDLAVSNSAGDDVAVFRQTGGASYAASADQVLGDALATPGLGAIAVGDLDGDGDLDIVSANTSANTLAVFEQISPAVFGAQPAAVLGSAADTNGPRAVLAVDLNGDRRLDIASANATSGSVALFFQGSSGGFPLDADALLGTGAIGAPVSIAAGDFDGDGRMDLVTANSSANSLAVFLQAGGGFGNVVPELVGSGATTKNPSHVVAVDIDRDGDLDLVCVNTAGNDIAVFLNPGSGIFPAAPSFVLGSAASTNAPRYVAVGDLDGDGDLDIATANGGNNTLSVFLQGAPGSFPAAPSFSLSSASLQIPDTIAIADVDRDGDMDIVSGNTGTKNLTVFRQGLPGSFASPPVVVGGAGSTDSPRTLLLLDLDGDGDLDLVSAEPVQSGLTVFFGSH